MFDSVAFFFSSRRRHTRFSRDWSSDVCSSDLVKCLGRVIKKISIVLKKHINKARLTSVITTISYCRWETESLSKNQVSGQTCSLCLNTSSVICLEGI